MSSGELHSEPIGIFDSGVGGLSIALAICKQLSNENLLYVADLKYMPYGDKSSEFILKRSVQIMNFLLGKKM